jgi:hypothetical protein
MVTTSLMMKIFNFLEKKFLISEFWIFFLILKFYEILWKLKFFKFVVNFRVFVNRRWSPSVPNKYKTFIQSGRELKIRENDSHCRSLVLKTMDRSIVKQLEKEKNSNFKVENFVVMFIYWGTINRFTSTWKTNQ